MLDATLLSSIAKQWLTAEEVEVGGRRRSAIPAVDALGR